MRNDIHIQFVIAECPDTDRRTIRYPADLTKHLVSMHWSAASNAYIHHMRLFLELSRDMDYSERGMRLRDKLASLN